MNFGNFSFHEPSPKKIEGEGYKSLVDNLAAAMSQENVGQDGSVKPINEIIVKMEMKKFQNLINNRLQRKNNLVNADTHRVFPMNKIADGTATVAQAPTSFAEGLVKLNPKLFTFYEKLNKKQQGAKTTSRFKSTMPAQKQDDTMMIVQSIAATRDSFIESKLSSYKNTTTLPNSSYIAMRPKHKHKSSRSSLIGE